VARWFVAERLVGRSTRRATHLVEDVIDRLPQLGARAAYFKQAIHEKLIEHKQYITQHGDDIPAISDWKWGLKASKGARGTSTEGDNV
jgi:xylulose-5-phosphate/fructose-6-phosphate phosphoketolase